MLKMKNIIGILLVLLAIVSLMLLPVGTIAAPSTTLDDLLEGSYRIEQDGWIFVHLQGDPYQIGFQNGYLAADVANQQLIYYPGTEGGYRDWLREMAETIWPMVPQEYQEEMEGIVDGLHAAGYDMWDIWDIVALNAWAEEEAYGSCSAFIATGDATTDGQIVMGHITMSDIAFDYMWRVIFEVRPDEGYAFRHQSTGGVIWSGIDWYINEAGLMVTETSLSNDVVDFSGTPVFVRIRQAIQYTDNIDDFIEIMTTNNSGAYPNEWLIGDAKTGEICSLMLGCNAWDINRTFNGFYPSCNYPYYENFRGEIGRPWPAPDSEKTPRVIRFEEFIDQYYGKVDVEVGKLILEDDIISRYGPNRNMGYDGKVTSTALALEDMGFWARWGNPAGKEFDLEGFLETRSAGWIEANQDAIAGLQRFMDGTPNPWTYMLEAVVDIDIRQGSINLRSRGMTPVAVLSSQTFPRFKASYVDPESVTFAGANPVRWTLEDVDGDGELDILFFFRTQDLDLTRESTEATLTGSTYAGRVFQSTGTVRVVPRR